MCTSLRGFQRQPNANLEGKFLSVTVTLIGKPQKPHRFKKKSGRVKLRQLLTNDKSNADESTFKTEEKVNVQEFSSYCFKKLCITNTKERK